MEYAAAHHLHRPPGVDDACRGSEKKHSPEPEIVRADGPRGFATRNFRSKFNRPWGVEAQAAAWWRRSSRRLWGDAPASSPAEEPKEAPFSAEVTPRAVARPQHHSISIFSSLSFFPQGHARSRLTWRTAPAVCASAGKLPASPWTTPPPTGRSLSPDWPAARSVEQGPLGSMAAAKKDAVPAVHHHVEAMFLSVGTRAATLAASRGTRRAPGGCRP